jgi:hypothetical protein
MFVSSFYFSDCSPLPPETYIRFELTCHPAFFLARWTPKPFEPTPTPSSTSSSLPPLPNNTKSPLRSSSRPPPPTTTPPLQPSNSASNSRNPCSRRMSRWEDRKTKSCRTSFPLSPRHSKTFSNTPLPSPSPIPHSSKRNPRPTTLSLSLLHLCLPSPHAVNPTSPLHHNHHLLNPRPPLQQHRQRYQPFSPAQPNQ